MKPNPSFRATFADSTASVLFDLLRGLAALLVFASHVRNGFFVEYPQLPAHRLLLIVPYTLTGAGHQAVVIFFILSGFFISGSVFRSVERNRWRWRDYLLRRLLRLWVVLLPALLLCLFCDSLGRHYGHAPGLYRGLSFTASSWFGTLFFTQTLLVPVFGSDGALWSLANEFWYYLLFPLGYLALRRPTHTLQRCVFAALALAIAWFIRGEILRLFPIWLAGTLLTRIPPPTFSARTGRRALFAATPLYLLVLFCTSRNRSYSTLLGDYLLTTATFGLLWLMLALRDRSDPSAIPVRISRNLARFSYSLYALHLPMLVFAAAFTLGDAHWLPTLPHVFFTLGLCAVVLVYAYAVATLTEFRTDALRRRLEKLIGLPAPHSALPSNPAAD